MESSTAGRIHTRTVDMHVRRLRAKLRGAGELIETVRGSATGSGTPSGSRGAGSPHLSAGGWGPMGTRSGRTWAPCRRRPARDSVRATATCARGLEAVASVSGPRLVRASGRNTGKERTRMAYRITRTHPPRLKLPKEGTDR